MLNRDSMLSVGWKRGNLTPCEYRLRAPPKSPRRRDDRKPVPGGTHAVEGRRSATNRGTQLRPGDSLPIIVVRRYCVGERVPAMRRSVR